MANLMHHQLDRLKQSVLDLADRAVEALDLAERVWASPPLPHRSLCVPDADTILDDLEDDIGRQVDRLLALHAPIGPNLRLVLASARVAGELERLGDLAGQIVRGRKATSLALPEPLASQLPELSGWVRQMVRLSVEAFALSDASRGRRVIAADAAVDGLGRQIMQGIEESMTRSLAWIPSGLVVWEVARAWQRAGDHATNVAEEALYLADGDVIRHRRPGLETRSGQGSESEWPQGPEPMVMGGVTQHAAV